MKSRREFIVSTVQRLRDSIGRIRQRREPIGEQNTKMALINPLLSAQGWDLEDLDEVSLEYRRKPQDNPVDYALFLLRVPCLFVEAKALDASLSDRKWISQTLGYATVVGVEWCVLTNGDEYRLYNAHAPVDAEEKLFRTVRISDASQKEHVVETLELLSKEKMREKSLNALWKAHFIDRRIRASLESLVKSQDESFVRLLHKKTSGLTQGDIRNSLKRVDLRVEFPTRNISPSVNSFTHSSQKREKRISAREKSKRRKSPTVIPVTISDLIESGLIHPPLEIEVEYKRNRLSAMVQSTGTVLFSGKTYTSLSVAGGMARNSVNGPPHNGRPYYQTNGWTFWKYKDLETHRLKEIDHLRRLYLKSNRVSAARS